MKRLLVDSALITFTEFFSLLGSTPKEAISEAGPDITFLGLRAPFPSSSTRFELSARLDDTMRTSWVAMIDSYLKAQSISHQELEKLIGRLSFAQTLLLGGIRSRPDSPALQEALHQVLLREALSPRTQHLGVVDGPPRILGCPGPNLSPSSHPMDSLY